MPLKDLVDPDGNHLNVLDVDGYYIPFFGDPTIENDFKRMKDWQARDDDIMCCNYTKSGTHWIWEMVQMLYKQSPEFLDESKEDFMMEKNGEEKFNSLPSSRPRILNTHTYFSMLPKDFIRRKCKIIYTIRNPKDVAVSLYHHHSNLMPYGYKGEWESYLTHRFLTGFVDFGSWFDYVLDWNKVMEENKDYPFHVVQYEDLHEDCVKEIKRLAKFLDIKCDDKLAKAISQKCDIEVMKKEKKQELAVWRTPHGMFREGKVGGWRAIFKDKENNIFDEMYKDKMSKFPMKLKFTIKKFTK